MTDDVRMRARIAAILLCCLAPSIPPQEPGVRHAQVRAIDGFGRPLAEVEISMLDISTGIASDAIGTTRADGLAVLTIEPTLAALMDQAHVPMLQFKRRGRATVMLPFADDRETAGLLELGDVPMPPGVNLRGVVRDDSGAPVAGAVVTSVDALRWRLNSAFGWTSGFSNEGAAGPGSCAVTDLEGRFELHGACVQGSRVHAQKRGHLAALSPPVGIGDRIELTLAVTGFARGIAVDGDGKPVECDLMLFDEVGQTESVHAGPDGHFEIGLPSRHRYVIEDIAAAYADDHPAIAEEAWLSGSRQDLRVVTTSAATVDAPVESIPVRVLDARSGESIAGARAGVIWESSLANMQPAPAYAATWAPPGSPAADGVPRVPPPGPDQDHAGLVVVSAPGHVTLSRSIHWRAGGLELEIRLVRAASLRGAVIDEVSGQPVAGAQVIVGLQTDTPLPLDQMGIGSDAQGNARLAAATTLADGSFELTELTPGTFQIWASSPGRVPSVPQVVKLRSGRTEEAVELRLRRGASLWGRLTTQPGTTDGMWLIVESPIPDHEEQWRSRESITWDAIRRHHGSRVSADGGFRIDGLPPGNWVVLVLPATTLAGMVGLPTKVGDIVLTDEDIQRDFEVRGLAASRMSGSVTIDGAELPLNRVAVVASLDDEDGQLDPGHHDSVPASWCAPDPTGAYELRLADGDWTIRVLDVVTGIQLSEPSVVEVRGGAPIARDLHVECGAVHVRVATKAALPLSSSRYILLALADADPNVAGLNLAGMILVAGLDISDGSTDVTVYLPTVDCDLDLATWRIDPANPRAGMESVGPEVQPVRVRAQRGKVIEVELGKQ